MATSLDIPGVDSIPTMPGGGPYYYGVSPDYFATVGLGVVRGRGLAPSDGETAEKVVVVSRTMADGIWPDTDPLGACMVVGQDDDTCRTVVGVVEDAARNGYQDAPFMAYYLPLAQLTTEQASGLYVRVRGAPDDAVGEVARTLRSFSPLVRYASVETLRARLDPQARSWALGATMFSLFGVLALVVAAVGLYSVLAVDVARRTRELGIRAALGARRARLLRSVLVEGTRLAVFGVVLGLLVAWIAAPRASDLLFEVDPHDAGTLAAVALALVAVAVAASLIPGMRATRVDPSEALRAE
jgi:predicted lysophospholipase L1 biosynthesis ABC-type transport system permease subunit